MEKKFNRKPLAIAIGTAFAASMTFSGVAAADSNPFQVQEVKAGDSGYVRLADAGNKDSEDNCSGKKDSEANCSGKKDSEDNCSGKKDKDSEDNCSGKKSSDSGSS